ncbi:hypothetical protein EI94DRAFT_1696117 [Lactarius quietus]|nr:hypothetical protein EI94DRAFT_1696117 [Lactarius quietus]
MPPARHEQVKTRASPISLLSQASHVLNMNQHLPCPPDDELQPILQLYFHLGMSDKDIATAVMDHFDHVWYSLSVYTVRRRRKKWGLESTCKQKHTVQSIAAYVEDIKKRFPNRGAETIRKALLLENKICVSRPIISEYLRQTEPDAVDARCMTSLSITAFSFTLAFHLGIPLITQSDPGTENVHVAYAQTALRHQMEPLLARSIQHRWFHKHGNIKPEIHWSIFRRDWAVGFQALLDKGVDNRYYDIGDPLECLLFRFVFIPFIQWEVDGWVHQRNWTKRCSDRKKVLPNGIPMIIVQKPHRWKAVDYKISVPPAVFDKMERKYAPPYDPVFDLVPYAFAEQANAVWTAMGSPQLEFDNAWEIYLQMRDALRAVTQRQTLQQILLSTCEPQNCLDEIPHDLRPTDEDDLLVVDDSDDKDTNPVVDLTDINEDHGEDKFVEGHSLDFCS